MVYVSVHVHYCINVLPKTTYMYLFECETSGKNKSQMQGKTLPYKLQTEQNQQSSLNLMLTRICKTIQMQHMSVKWN